MWQSLQQLDLRGCNLEIEELLLKKLATVLALHPRLSIILIDDCFPRHENELFFTQLIIQQRQQFFTAVSTPTKALLFANAIPRLTALSPMKVFNGDQNLIISILKYADSIELQEGKPHISISQSIKFR